MYSKISIMESGFQEFLYENQLGAACIAKNDNCVPRRLRDQPKKIEKNWKNIERNEH